MPGNYRSISELLIGYAGIFVLRSYPQRPTSEHSTGNQVFGWLFIAEPWCFSTLPSASLHSASNHGGSNLGLLTYADASGMLRKLGKDHSNKMAIKCFEWSWKRSTFGYYFWYCFMGISTYFYVCDGGALRTPLVLFLFKEFRLDRACLSDAPAVISSYHATFSSLSTRRLLQWLVTHYMG